MITDRIEAPWTVEQVAALNAYQACYAYHPFTGQRGPNGEETILIATQDGWVERDDGPVVQTWAYEFMAQPHWRSRNMAPAKSRYRYRA